MTDALERDDPLRRPPTQRRADVPRLAPVNGAEGSDAPEDDRVAAILEVHVPAAAPDAAAHAAHAAHAGDDAGSAAGEGPTGSEEPEGSHVSRDDPLRGVGLVVAAGLNVLRQPVPPRGAHVGRDDPLLAVEDRAVHGTKVPAAHPAPRGAHVGHDDPLLAVERRAVHAANVKGAPDRRGVHARADDPLLAVERRAVHAARPGLASPPTPLSAAELQAMLETWVASLKTRTAPKAGTSVIPIGVPARGDASTPASGTASHDGAAPDGAVTAETTALASAGRDPSFGMEVRRSLQREIPVEEPVDLASRREGARPSARRRWRLVPLAGAAGAVAAGLGGGTAVAFIVSHGSGTAQTVGGSPVAVTMSATAGTADLLPGQAGAVSFALHDPGAAAATFDQITPGASVVSDNAALCASDEVRIAPTLPYTLASPISVSPGSSNGVQSIPGLVMLDPGAPSACQGVTFTVTFTLSGQSS